MSSRCTATRWKSSIARCRPAPPLIKGYLKLGARVCGQPAWDPDFNAADFPVLLKMDGMDERYRRHFGLDQPAPTGQR